MSRRSRRRQRPRGRKRGIALLLAAVLLVVGTIAASETTDSRELDPPSPQDVPLAASGTAYCPVTAAEGEGALLVLSATGTEDSEVVISRFAEGERRTEEPTTVPAGTSAQLSIPSEQLGQPLTVDWRGGPLVAQYQLTDGAEVLAASCIPRPSLDWHLTGFDTSLGSVSLLHLFNPFSQDALVSLQFGTQEGDIDLVIADELLIPAGGSTVLNLAQFRPETPDLAVTVTARAGRVIPQGQVDFAPPAEGVEGVTGRALIPAVPTPSEVAVIPEATIDAVTDAWVTVYNPDVRAAAVQVQVSTPLGDASRLASEITVPAGGTARIDLAELSALPRFGVRITSVNGVGVVATRVAAISDAQRTGVAVAVGAPDVATSWAVTGAFGPESTVTLYNPSGEVATARVDVAGGRPETWTAVNVPPNGVATLDLAEATPAGPALVTADVPLVAGVVNLRPESATAYWSATGTPQDDLVGGGTALPALRDPALLSVPAISATATPTAAPVDPEAEGEGELGPEVDTTTSPVPASSATPSIEAGSEDPEPEAQPTGPTPTPTPTGAAPPPPSPEPGGSPGPSPLPPGATEEGSLFGKRRGGRRAR